MLSEAATIGTALSFARDDIGFLPRIYLLGMPKELISIETTAGLIYVRPHMDTYGYRGYSTGAAQVYDTWAGPYGAKSQTQLSQGSRTVIRVRLIDTQTIGLRSLFEQQLNEDISLVYWPADTWGNPWMVYEVLVERINGELNYRLARSGEEANYLHAVVSYGPNGVPGGNERTSIDSPNYFRFLRDDASLYIKGDLLGNEADYTLKARFTNTSQGQLPLDFSEALERSLHYVDGDPVIDDGLVGILDEGSDDVIYPF
jgi:hypothetical protein